MNELPIKYIVASRRIRPECLLPGAHPHYQHPTPDEVKTAIKSAGLTGEEIALLTGVKGRTVRKWQAPMDTSNYAPMPYSAWRLLLLETGMVDNPMAGREELRSLREGAGIPPAGHH
jgi:hypothetical protein